MKHFFPISALAIFSLFALWKCEKEKEQPLYAALSVPVSRTAAITVEMPSPPKQKDSLTRAYERLFTEIDKGQAELARITKRRRAAKISAPSSIWPIHENKADNPPE